MYCKYHSVCVIDYNLFRGESVKVQKGKVSASAWMDCKVVMVMSSNCQPDGVGTILRRQQDGSRIPVTCPESIICYNEHMGGVDCGDQFHGYYSCRTKSRKFYKYIFTFLLNVAITNAFILMKHYCPTCPFANIKSFRLQLAKELMAEYCSRRRRGRGGTIIRPLPYRHFPITMEDENNAPRKRVDVHSILHLMSMPLQLGNAGNVRFGYVTAVILPVTAS